MRIASFDCATHTGWALIEDGKIVESGTMDFSKRRGESNGVMFLRFRTWLNEFAYQNVKVVACEKAHHRGGAATEIGVHLFCCVQEFCAAEHYEFLPLHTAEIKKFATGKGNAGKPEMMEAAEKKLGRPPLDDNEADAVMIGLLADQMLNPKRKGGPRQVPE